MKFKPFFITVLFSFIILLPIKVMAQDDTYDLGPMEYKFHLNFKDGILTPIIKQYDVLPYEFVSEQFVDQPGLYYGKVFSMANQQLAEFHYNLLSGENEVLAPYFSEAKTVAFYRSSGDADPLLAIPVSKTALCNEDKVCQRDAGETENNCHADCGLGSNSNNAISNSNSGIGNPNPDTIAQKYYNFLIISFIVLGIVTIVVFVIIFLKRNRNK